MNKGDYTGLFPGLTANQSGLDTLAGGMSNISAEISNAFDPTLFAPMWGWWEVDRGVTTVGDAVSNWQSRVEYPVTGVKANFRQTTAAQRPTIVRCRCVSGQPYIRFNSASSQWLTNDLAPLIQEAYWIIVAKCRNINAGSQYLLGSRSSTETRIRTIAAGGLDTINFQIQGNANTTINQYAETRSGQMAVYVMSTFTDAHFMRTNMCQKRNIVYTAATPNGFNLASRFTGPAQNGSVDICAVFAFSSPITDDQYIRTFNYLKNKYKVPM